MLDDKFCRQQLNEPCVRLKCSLSYSTLEEVPQDPFFSSRVFYSCRKYLQTDATLGVIF